MFVLQGCSVIKFYGNLPTLVQPLLPSLPPAATYYAFSSYRLLPFGEPFLKTMFKVGDRPNNLPFSVEIYIV